VFLHFFEILCVLCGLRVEYVRDRRCDMPKRLKLTVRAHAKVNLDLRVLGVRADGYHELRTVFQTIELHDTLVCSDLPGPFTLKCKSPNVPLDATNLVWKAATALWTAVGRAGDIRDTFVHIDKKIPIEAGLGGGSAGWAGWLKLSGIVRLSIASLNVALRLR